jgi:hypothetical protein
MLARPISIARAAGHLAAHASEIARSFFPDWVVGSALRVVRADRRVVARPLVIYVT